MQNNSGWFESLNPHIHVCAHAGKTNADLQMFCHTFASLWVVDRFEV